jgi:hypothetical protein
MCSMLAVPLPNCQSEALAQMARVGRRILRRHQAADRIGRCCRQAVSAGELISYINITASAARGHSFWICLYRLTNGRSPALRDEF